MNEQIQKVKDKLTDGVLSFIVGAGFSKNLFHQFPSWGELLYNMVYILYKDEIKNSYYTYAKGKMSYRVFRKYKFNEIIKREGYLTIASNYIKKIGGRENIDIYIEKETPYLIKNKDGFKLLRNKQILAEGEKLCLDVHRGLLSLGVNNIYTFNFDNLLDLIAGADKEEELQKENDKLQKEYRKFKEAVEKYQDNKSILIKDFSSQNSTQKQEMVEIINRYIKDLDLQVSLSGKDIEEVLENIDDEIRKKNNELSSEIDDIYSKSKDLYHLVKNAWDISLSANRKNIYKLHGNLRIDSLGEYGFDNDIHHQYIICQEDYDTYPQRHEAFIHLMKLSLLKDSFCVVGFSGDDPNFLNWISWVREILQAEKRTKPTEKRVFFIDAVGTKLAAGKELLFDNNNIQYISLEKIYQKGNPKENLLYFFDDLQEHNQEYKILLKEISSGNQEEICKLWRFRTSNRLPLLSDSITTIYRQKVLSQIQEKIQKQSVITETDAKAFYVALTGERLFIPEYFNSKINDWFVEASDEVRKAFQLLNIKKAVVENKPISIAIELGNAYYYERIWQLLFNLQFQDAKYLLENWKLKEGLWITRRLALLSLFGNLNEKEITAAMNRSLYENIQEYIYALNILPAIRGVYYFLPGGGMSTHCDVSKKLEGLLQRYENLHELSDDIDFLKKALLETVSKTEPYGSTRYIYRLSRYDTELLRSVQLLQTFLEIGLPMQNKSTIFLDFEVWYKAFKHLYEDYPYPCLYFSLQYGDNEQYIYRIAQDYAYSYKLKPILPGMVGCLLKAYLNNFTPSHIKKGILYMCLLLMRCTKNEVWEELFGAIVKNCDFSSTDIDRARLNPEYNFIKDGLRISRDIELKQYVCLSCLKKMDLIDKVDNSLIVTACYHLEKVNTDIKKQIDGLLKKASKPAHYFVLGNLHRYMNRSQHNCFQLQLKNYTYLNEQEAIMFELAIHYVGQDSLFIENLKKAIINSETLWYTGIKDGWATGGEVNPIRISGIQKKLSFNHEEIKKIYCKMLEALRAIQPYYEKKSKPSIFSWRNLVQEMYMFVLYNKELLKTESDYPQILESIENFQKQERGATTLSDALTSSDDYKVRQGIESMIFEIKVKGIRNIQNEYLIIANRILMGSEAGLSHCINHFSQYLSKYKQSFNRKLFLPVIIEILNKYKFYFDENQCRVWNLSAAKEEVEEAMLKLYEVCKKWGYDDSFWGQYFPMFTCKDI